MKRRQKLFCSKACRRALERRQRTEEWLAGGDVAVAGNHRHYVRLHILGEQAGRCAICGQSGEWNGLPLTLVLDHIDEDASNNRRENLRLVCPNCDSQLPTVSFATVGTAEPPAATVTVKEVVLMGGAVGRPGNRPGRCRR